MRTNFSRSLTSHRRRLQTRLGALSVTLLLVGQFMSVVNAQGVPVVARLYVHTERGDDLNDGSAAFPFKSLNKALGKAFELRYTEPPNPCTDEPIEGGLNVRILVTAPTTPIAPDTHGGGNELAGWQSYKDVCLNITRPAFPIRMIKKVSIEGVPTNGNLPRVLIDESNGTNPYTSFTPSQIPRNSYFIGAPLTTLSNFHLDGSLYHQKKTDSVNALFLEKTVVLAGEPPAEVPAPMTISNCVVDDLFNGLYFQAKLAGDKVFATVTDCQLLSLGPLDFSGTIPSPEDQGHAGVWLIGAGTLDIAFSGTFIEGCHDAIEIAGEEMTSGELTLTNCTFFENENVVEAVGSGSLVVTATGCSFDSNYNFLDGMPLFHPSNGAPFSPAVIAARGMDENTVTVRSCAFFNNAFCALVNSPGTYDFGLTGTNSPGLNTFDIDFSVFPSADPIRTVMQVGEPTAVVTAGGNTWYHVNLNQGTTANGCLINPPAGPPVGAPTVGWNLVPFTLLDSSTIWVPPGPAVGMTNPATGQDWLRNYSLSPAATIDLGSDCVP